MEEIQGFWGNNTGKSCILKALVIGIRFCKNVDNSEAAGSLTWKKVAYQKLYCLFQLHIQYSLKMSKMFRKNTWNCCYRSFFCNPATNSLFKDNLELTLKVFYTSCAQFHSYLRLFLKFLQKSLTFSVPTPKNSETHSNNSLTVADELFECVWLFYLFIYLHFIYSWQSLIIYYIG